MALLTRSFWKLVLARKRFKCQCLDWAGPGSERMVEGKGNEERGKGNWAGGRGRSTFSRPICHIHNTYRRRSQISPPSLLVSLEWTSSWIAAEVWHKQQQQQQQQLSLNYLTKRREKSVPEVRVCVCVITVGQQTSFRLGFGQSNLFSLGQHNSKWMNERKGNLSWWSLKYYIKIIYYILYLSRRSGQKLG